jgi:hypothetical protein
MTMSTISWWKGAPNWAVCVQAPSRFISDSVENAAERSKVKIFNFDFIDFLKLK